ncbi:MAG: type II secretion system major pseudopilin GspG [Planctomycetales bacterium]|nr:type II secretion system major pseudopilin GspG [Planctomycetales bacterium]
MTRVTSLIALAGSAVLAGCGSKEVRAPGDLLARLLVSMQEGGGEQEAWMKLAQPGPHHGHLKALEGKWLVKAKATFMPGQPVEESEGKCTYKMILGGRFLQQEIDATMGGMPFQGVGLTGYDNDLKKYVGCWMDSMGTMMMTFSGTCSEEGKVLTTTSEFKDPMSGQMKKAKMVTRVVDKDKHTFEMFDVGADGKESKILELTYTRRPPKAKKAKGAVDPRTLGAKAQIANFATALEMYDVDNARYPTSEEGLGALAQAPKAAPAAARWKGPYVKALPQDPWGNAFRYQHPGTHGKAYDLWSAGPDGKDGTADDVTSWAGK